MSKGESELIYDWNSIEKRTSLAPAGAFTFFDETLRDGIQSPSVVDPSIEDKLRLTELANDLGIQHINIGLPGAGPRAVEDCIAIASHIARNKLAIRPGCAENRRLAPARRSCQCLQGHGRAAPGGRSA